MLKVNSSWNEANILEIVRTRSGSSQYEASIATVIAAAETTVHELPTPRAMNNRTTATTVQEEKEYVIAFPEAALAAATTTTTTYGDIAYRNDIESKMSTLSACSSTPESLTSYEVENSSPNQSALIIDISQSASTTLAAAATTATAAFDAAAPVVMVVDSNNDNTSREGGAGGGGGGGGSITRSIKSSSNRNNITNTDNCQQEHTVIDEERDDNAAAAAAAVLINNTAEDKEDQHRQPNDYNEDEMSVELSIATQPTMQSPVVSPTSYTTGGTGNDDNVSMADCTVLTCQPLLVEQYASMAENNEVEVQFTKTGKKVKLSRKSKNIMFNPFKSSTEKTVKTAAATAAAAEKKKRIASPLHNLVISSRVNEPEEIIASSNGLNKQSLQMVDLVDSLLFSPTTNVSTTLNTTLAEISEDNIEVQACFDDDDDKSSSHEGRGSTTLIVVNTATLNEEPRIQDQVVHAAMSLEQASSGSVHSHLVSSSNRPYSPVAKNQTTSTSEEALHVVESETLHSISTVTTAVVMNSPSLLAHNKYTSPLVRGISLQKAKLFKRFGRFTKKSSSNRMTKVKSAPLVKLDTVLESVTFLPECKPELLQPYEAAKTSDDHLIIPVEVIPDSSTLEIITQETLRATKTIERKQSPHRDDLSMAESVKLLASYDSGFSHSSIKSVAFVTVATNLEDNAPEQTDHTDDVMVTATTASNDNIYQAQIPSKSISNDGPTTVVDHEPEAIHPMNDEHESHDIISYPTSSTVNTSVQESDASGSKKKQTRMFLSKNMSKKAITSASARLSDYFNKKDKGKPFVELSTTSDQSPGSTFTDTQEAVFNSTDKAAGDTKPQINPDVSIGEVNDAYKLATHTTPEGFVTKQDNDEEMPMHAEAKLYHALAEVKEKVEIAFTKREYASQKLVEKNTLEEELSSLLATMSKGNDLENQETRMIMMSKVQIKVDHVRAEHAKAELASILAMAEANKARDDAKRDLNELSKKKNRKTNRKKICIEEEGGDDEEDMSFNVLDSVSTASTMDSGHSSFVVEQADKNWLLDSEFIRYICCNGRDDFTMISVDITDSLIGISHESSEIKESEYRIRDNTSLLDLLVT